MRRSDPPSWLRHRGGAATYSFADIPLGPAEPVAQFRGRKGKKGDSQEPWFVRAQKAREHGPAGGRTGEDPKASWKGKIKPAIRGDLGDTNQILSRQGEAGPFDRHFSSPQLFWRGDDREPFGGADMMKNGFSPLQAPPAAGKNEIMWRSGNNQDDLDGNTAVCVTGELRGSAFFPLTKQAKYVYAFGLTQVVDTHAAQELLERHETGSSRMRAHRYPYDPQEQHGDQSGAIWQYGEYAAHQIPGKQIIAVFEIERRTLAPMDGGTHPVMSGIQFKLKLHHMVPTADKQVKKLQRRAVREARRYADWYPSGDDYLSYQGIVRNRSHFEPADMNDLAEMHQRGHIQQVDPLPKNPMPDERLKEKRRANRLQKKRKKGFRAKRGN